MSASVVNTVEDFAFINFKIFPNPSVIPPNCLAGETININFRCCLLTHTFFNFLFTPLIMLICASWACMWCKTCTSNTQSDCHQWLSDSSRVHQIRFRPGLCPGPRWGSSRRSPRPPSRLGRGIPPPHSPPPRRRLRRLGLVAYGDSTSHLRRSIVYPPSSRNPPQCLGVWIKHCQTRNSAIANSSRVGCAHKVTVSSSAKWLSKVIVNVRYRSKTADFVAIIDRRTDGQNSYSTIARQSWRAMKAGVDIGIAEASAFSGRFYV